MILDLQLTEIVQQVDVNPLPSFSYFHNRSTIFLTLTLGYAFSNLKREKGAKAGWGWEGRDTDVRNIKSVAFLTQPYRGPNPLAYGTIFQLPSQGQRTALEDAMVQYCQVKYRIYLVHGFFVCCPCNLGFNLRHHFAQCLSPLL